MAEKRPYPKKRRGPAKAKRQPLKAGSDAKLKKVFAEIGRPEKRPFKPDPFQTQALKAMDKGDCLVTAPTGSGKTWIAVEAIRKIFDAGGRAWYASPLKALTNSKYCEFAEIFGADNLGILTGDRKENTDAPIIVGTTEILRNQLYDAMHRGEDLGTDLVVLDEAHFLGDENRGVVWEETMIYLPARIPLLMLSATVGNAGQIAAWLESIRGRKCLVVEEKKRPVPLYPLFLHPSGTLFPLLDKKDKKGGGARLYKKVLQFLKNTNNARRGGFGASLPKMGDVLAVFRKYNLLPAIFFLKSRADCDNALLLCADYKVTEDPERKAGRRQRVTELIEKAPHLADHKQVPDLVHKAVAAHHSGQLPAWKLVIETLMTEGYLDAVFATSTVAAGVNFPARTIAFLNSDRFNGREFISLNPTEFHQMTGRAGRRGMDNIGFAVVIPGRFMDTRYVGRLVYAQPTDVDSQIQINFSMTLNLLLSHSPKQVRELLDKSFANFQFQSRRKKKKKQTGSIRDMDHLWAEFVRHLDFLKQKDYVAEDNRLTEDGIWASQLRIDHPLMVAEGFRQNLFPQSDPALLAAIMAAFVNERETDEDSIHPKDVPEALEEAYLGIREGLRPFAKEMIAKGFTAPFLFMRPAMTVYHWTAGRDWESVLALWDSAEGDLAMLIMRTADNLRHIRNLKTVFPEAAQSAKTAMEQILRDPVVPALEAE
ncbi:superfamily II RNA helicase [Desulfosalsimonas propionicica]|uniref:Superfamily II RNA helicase n=1 Tax=Desulfosalsimonas propionicica TaxID=332175 RepID=A0A7W0HLS9_9BACT|nr:DEAD/DEAH box helicase [Desulfosalsimonas propionicica]MBA2882635.1 superfamily II RNA helicase [Desulfosalsimonas propionicica]